MLITITRVNRKYNPKLCQKKKEKTKKQKKTLTHSVAWEKNSEGRGEYWREGVEGVDFFIVCPDSF